MWYTLLMKEDLEKDEAISLMISNVVYSGRCIILNKGDGKITVYDESDVVKSVEGDGIVELTDAEMESVKDDEYYEKGSPEDERLKAKKALEQDPPSLVELLPLQ